jgi:hypothetical protein
MRKSILSSVLDVCQNIFDSQFFRSDGRVPIWDKRTGTLACERMSRSDPLRELAEDSAADGGTGYRYIFAIQGMGIKSEPPLLTPRIL